jgi:hypothetical protein
MLKIYYRIWVSLFLKIKLAQNGNKNASLILSLIVLSATNIINILLIGILLILIAGIHSNIFDMLPVNKTIRNLSIALFVFLSNYFLLVHNGKNETLLTKYENQNIKNLGSNYFIISTILVLLLIFSTIAFPEFFNLTVKK